MAKSRGEDASRRPDRTSVEETPTTLAEEAAGTAAEGAETVDEAIEADRGRGRGTEADEAEVDEPRPRPRSPTAETSLDTPTSRGRGPRAPATADADASTTPLAQLEAHTKDELLELAEKAGVEVAKSWTKPQIAEAIVASREDD